MSRRAIVCGKETFAPEGDYFVTCSFDRSHVLLHSRMPYHIIKCIKNHPNHTKIQCPYDATEYFEKDEYIRHINECPSMRSSCKDKFNKALLKQKGLLCNLEPPPQVKPLIPECDEDWNPPTEWEEPEDKLISDDEDEDYCQESVGEGTRRRERTPPPKPRCVGRGELLRRILAERQAKQQSANSSSTSSFKSDTVLGQFDDQ